MTKLISSQKIGHFFTIDNTIAFDRRISGTPKDILELVLVNRNRKNLQLHKGYFVEVLGKSEKQICRAMKILVECGYAVKGDCKNGDYSDYIFHEVSLNPDVHCKEMLEKYDLGVDKNVHTEDLGVDKNVHCQSQEWTKMSTKSGHKCPERVDINVHLVNTAKTDKKAIAKERDRLPIEREEREIFSKKEVRISFTEKVDAMVYDKYGRHLDEKSKSELMSLGAQYKKKTVRLLIAEKIKTATTFTGLMRFVKEDIAAFAKKHNAEELENQHKEEVSRRKEGLRLLTEQVLRRKKNTDEDDFQFEYVMAKLAISEIDYDAVTQQDISKLRQELCGG